MKLTLNRFYKGPEYTIGRLYVDTVFFSHTLEDVDRGLRSKDSLAKIKSVKVAGETAIPRGTYEITLKVQSPKYKSKSQYAFCQGYLPRLLNVPGWEGVLLHAGNSAVDSAGCILPGVNSTKGKVTNSLATLKKLYAKLKEADEKGEKITITIE